MDIGTLLSWLVLGAVAGAIVHYLFTRRVGDGLVFSTLVGLLGAVVGGLVSNALFAIPVTGFNLSSLIIATLGAVVLTIIYRTIYISQGRPEQTVPESVRYGPSYASEVATARRNATIANPAEVESYLRDIDFPATKREIVEYAASHNASREVIDTLSLIPDQEYEGPTGVAEEIGKLR